MAGQLNSKVLASEGNKYNAPQNGMLGQGGTETWTFKAVGKGTQTIRMEYMRPWEKNTPPAKTQVFHVTVQ